MAFGLCRCWPGISAGYEYEVLSAPEFPIQAPRGWRDVRPGSAKYPEGPWLARSTRVYSPSPPTPALLWLRGKSIRLGWVSGY